MPTGGSLPVRRTKSNLSIGQRIFRTPLDTNAEVKHIVGGREAVSAEQSMTPRSYHMETTAVSLEAERQCAGSCRYNNPRRADRVRHRRSGRRAARGLVEACYDRQR